LGLLFVSLLTFFVWYRVLGQAFLAEGPMYLHEPYATQFFSGGIVSILNRYDLLALLFFRAFGDLAKDNMKFYFGFLLLGITLVNFGVFAAVREVTKSFTAGIISAALFISNFIGTFNMLGQGAYQFFIQRVPGFVFALFSFVFITKYFETKKIKYYLISFSLYAFGMFLCHYTFLFLPLLLYFIFAKPIFESFRSVKKWILAVVYVLPFVLWSYFLIRIQPALQITESSFSQFVISRHQLIPEILERLTIITVPQGIITFISKISEGLSFAATVSNLSYPIAVLYLAVAIFIAIKYKKMRAFILSIFFAILTSIVMALYLRINIVNEYSPNRYLYLPSMFVSIFWGLPFYLMIRKAKFFKITVFALLVVVFLHQRSLIMKAFEVAQPASDTVLSSISFIKSNYKNFPDNSLIILPANEGSCQAKMFERFYGERNIRYLGVNEDIKGEIKKSVAKKQKVFMLIYESGKTSLQKKVI
jgi:hypothetical protein